MQFRIENIAPILNIKDMTASLAFYVDLLGFKNAAWGEAHFTLISRDKTGIYLCRGGQGNAGTWVWIGFDGDLHLLYQYLQSRGANIILPPTNYSWALEMQVQDPDGHVLRFGTDPDPDKHFADK